MLIYFVLESESVLCPRVEPMKRQRLIYLSIAAGFSPPHPRVCSACVICLRRRDGLRWSFITSDSAEERGNILRFITAARKTTKTPEVHHPELYSDQE